MTQTATPTAPTTGPDPQTDRPSPLWRNARFQVLWAGSAASTLGTAIADVVYPLAILALTGSPADAGLFAAVQTTGVILAGLPAGHLVDKHSPRLVLIASESGRALVTGAVVAGLVMGWLSLPWLLVAAILLGIGQPMTSTARMLLVRAVVPKEQLTRALTQDEIRVNGAELAGPPLGGALFGLRVLAHAVPLVATAGSFALSVLSAILVRAEPDRGPADAEKKDSDGGSGDGGKEKAALLAGIRIILGNPMMRAATTLFATVNCLAGGLGLIAVVILRDQGVPAALIGLALAGGAVGGLAGAPLIGPLHRLRPGVLMIAVSGLIVPLFVLFALPYGPWWMAGLLFVAMLGIPSVRVLLDVLILRQAPPAERGRVVGAVMTLLAIGTPLGLAATGILLQYLSPATTVIIQAAALAIGVVACAARRQIWQARWPS